MTNWLLDNSTLQLSQHTPWAHCAPTFSVQLLALQQGLEHSCEIQNTITIVQRLQIQLSTKSIGIHFTGHGFHFCLYQCNKNVFANTAQHVPSTYLLVSFRDSSLTDQYLRMNGHVFKSSLDTYVVYRLVYNWCKRMPLRKACNSSWIFKTLKCSVFELKLNYGTTALEYQYFLRYTSLLVSETFNTEHIFSNQNTISPGYCTYTLVFQ